jgi:MFS family permease
LADWIGRRLTFAICIALSFVAITLELVAVNIEVFFGGKIINGFATGALASVCTTYIGEIAPLALRGILTVSNILLAC